MEEKKSMKKFEEGGGGETVGEKEAKQKKNY